ncbi:hypothetical protein FRB95_002021 [Tulasnella sp. JGI-2019a]|nr:hypothetical protein FRB95_002021 [Tulasnella sp. JGI-2019a]
MQYIHSKNIVHGDLKQLNILIDDAFKARITGFGFSEIKQYATSTLTLQSSRGPDTGGVGTLRYMSPEALQGVIDKGSDVYAFAMTVYEIFTNTPPFLLVPDGAICHHVGEKHTRLTRPTDPTTINRGLHDGIWALIWDASQPLAANRPDFSNICQTTERLAEDKRPILNQGMAIREEVVSEDIADLLGPQHRALCSFSITSDWGQLELVTLGAYFVIGSQMPVPQDMKVEDRKIRYRVVATAPPYPTVTIDELVLVYDGGPVQVSLSHGDHGKTRTDGTCIFTVSDHEYINAGLAGHGANMRHFTCHMNPQGQTE